MNSEHSSTDLKASDVPLHLIPAKKLSPGIRNKLSLLLNPPKIRETFVERILRDFQGLGYLMGFDKETVQQAQWSGDATKYLILKWISQDNHTVEELLKMIKRMERYDVLDDITPLLDKCVEDFLKFLKNDAQAKIALKALGKLSLIEDNSGEELKIVSRAEWGARPATENHKYVGKLKLVFIHHTKVSLPSSIETVRHLQSMSMDQKGRRDIPYNFIISQEGEIFEGTGWDYISCQDFQYMRMSISIGLIGDFNVDKPSSEMIESLKKLIRSGAEKNKIDKKMYSLMGYCDAITSDSPGTHVMELLMKMPNYKLKKKTNISLEEQEERRIQAYNYLRSNSLSPPVKFGGFSPPIISP